MLSFKALSEKKTKVKINPKLKDVMEKHGGKPCPKTGQRVSASVMKKLTKIYLSYL